MTLFPLLTVYDIGTFYNDRIKIQLSIPRICTKTDDTPGHKTSANCQELKSHRRVVWARQDLSRNQSAKVNRKILQQMEANHSLLYTLWLSAEHWENIQKRIYASSPKFYAEKQCPADGVRCGKPERRLRVGLSYDINDLV